MSFDYEAPTDVDVTPVVDAIRAHYRLPELSEEQKAEREITNELRRYEQLWRNEQRRAKREAQEQEAQAIARAEQAAALAEYNKKVRLDLQERDKERRREQQMVDLSIQTAQIRGWAGAVENSARSALRQRHRKAIMADLQNHFHPPQPPEPEPIVVADDGLGSPYFFDDNYNPNYYHDKFWGKSAK